MSCVSYKMCLMCQKCMNDDDKVLVHRRMKPKMGTYFSNRKQSQKQINWEGDIRQNLCEVTPISWEVADDSTSTQMAFL